nr:flavodoxin [uncultured Agathobaculum sp.]
MKTMLKQTLSLLLALCILFALAACGQDMQPQTSAPDETGPVDTALAEESIPVEEPESGNVLVAYFSATGNTEAVAAHIASTLGADTFEITPAEPYTSDDLNWTDENSRVTREHEDASLQTVELAENTPDNWDAYDTVFIGYPIWWGVAAWPVSSFVAENDFTGKTVIPFCTSSSSELGDSGTALEELTGTGEWLTGQRFRSSASESEVADWVNSLGFDTTQR